MAKTGCLRDGHFHNLEVESNTIVGPLSIGGKMIVGNGVSGLSSVDITAEGTTQLYALGTTLVYGDRTFRYCKMGAGAVTAGKLMVNATAEAQHISRPAVLGAAGATTISVTLGSTEAALNLYADGYLHINDGTAQGLLLRIKSHPAADASGTLVLTMYDKLGVVALTTSSICDLIINPYSGVFCDGTAGRTLGGVPVGVTVMDSSANNFVWLQISGPCSILYDENPSTAVTAAIGDILIRGAGVAGAVMVCGASGVLVGHPVIGTAYLTPVIAEHVIIWLSGIQ